MPKVVKGARKCWGMLDPTNLSLTALQQKPRATLTNSHRCLSDTYDGTEGTCSRWGQQTRSGKSWSISQNCVLILRFPPTNYWPDSWRWEAEGLNWSDSYCPPKPRRKICKAISCCVTFLGGGKYSHVLDVQPWASITFLLLEIYSAVLHYEILEYTGHSVFSVFDTP